MKVWTIVAVVWSSLLSQIWSASSNVTSVAADVSSSNTTTISNLGNNIPPEFILNVQTFPDRMIYIPNLWFMLFRFMITVAELEFPGRASPFKQSGGGFTLEIKPEPIGRGQPFRLHNQHLVWAVQRLSEKLYRSRDYRELDAKLQLYGIVVGRLTLRYHPVGPPQVGTSSQNETDLSSAQTLPAGNLTEDLHTPLNDSARLLLLTISLAQPPLPISKIETLLTLIRATAQIAAKTYSVLADDLWAYDDTETGLSLIYRKVPASTECVTWSSLSSLFVKFIRDFQIAGLFYEAEGRMVKRNPNTIFETFGIMFLMKSLTSSSLTELSTS